MPLKRMYVHVIRPEDCEDASQTYLKELGDDYFLYLHQDDEPEVIVHMEGPTSPEGPSTLVVTIPPDMLVRVEHLDEAHSA
jgi:hypothetical protein